MSREGLKVNDLKVNGLTQVAFVLEGEAELHNPRMIQLAQNIFFQFHILHFTLANDVPLIHHLHREILAGYIQGGMVDLTADEAHVRNMSPRELSILFATSAVQADEDQR